VLPVKAESVKTRPSGLRNRTLQFSQKLQIVLQLDQAQTVQVSQSMAHWSFSLKYSCVHASTEKCINTRIISKPRLVLLKGGEDIIMTISAPTTTVVVNSTNPIQI
jgi:hypothetical protein